MRWHDLLAGLDGPGGDAGAELTGDPDVEIDAITHDSRQVAPGAGFACIPGATTDGEKGSDLQSDAAESRRRNIDKQGRQSNIAVNTRNQGYQQDR